MEQSRVRDLVRRIQDIVAEATGKRLEGKDERRLEELLDGGKRKRPGRLGEEFSHRDVTILLADLRGFMAMTASRPAGTVLELLNECFGRLSELIVGHRGAIDKFMGDAILAIFAGEPGARGEDARRALQCAVEMQIAIDRINLLPAVFLLILNAGLWAYFSRGTHDWTWQGYPVGFAGCAAALLGIAIRWGIPPKAA